MKRVLLIAIAALLLTCFACTPSGPDERLDLYAFSVGKADALLIKTNDAAIMIDTGENGDGDELVEKLVSLGVNRLDLLILTHFDKDHIGGADTIIRCMPIDRIMLPSYEKDSKQYTQLLGALAETDAKVEYLAADTEIKYGDTEVFVWVSPVAFDGESDNEQSLITKVRYSGRNYLFMGDAEGKELKKLIYGDKNLTCDVLKLPHHGVYDDNTFMLMTTSMPSYVVICDSQKNPADAETLQSMELYDPVILQTKDGDVHLYAVNGVIGAEE